MTATAATIIAAHRGGALIAPENSMTAFRRALGLGVEQIETDIHLSADGEPFILHDVSLDRTTTEVGIAAERTWRELSSVRLRDTAEDCIPHLDELLELMRPSGLGLRLELKRNAAGDADPRLLPRALVSLEAVGMAARTTFTSFDRRYLAAVIDCGKGGGVIWLVARDIYASLGAAGVMAVAHEAGIAEIALHASQMNSGDVALARGHALRLGFYAVNDAATIEPALDCGASAFTSDRPDLAVAIRAARRDNRT